MDIPVADQFEPSGLDALVAAGCRVDCEPLPEGCSPRGRFGRAAPARWRTEHAREAADV